jgi:phospholipid transport system transporter-binding protein
MSAIVSQAARTQSSDCLAVQGELTLATVAEVWRSLLRLQASRIDMAGVTRADSAGLALLIAWRAARSPTVVTYENVPQSLRALARLTDAESLLNTE